MIGNTFSNGGLNSLESVFDSPMLSNLIPAFVQCGFDNIEFLVSLSEQEMNEMFNAIENKCYQLGINYSPAIKIQLKRKIQQLQGLLACVCVYVCVCSLGFV